MNVAYNRDCMDVMKEYPDGYFDLAVVDPPYGDALHTDGGGNMGWFTKYREDSRDGSQTVHVERERERGRPIDHLHSSRRQEERRRLEPIRTAVRPLQARNGSDSTGEARTRTTHGTDTSDRTTTKKIISWDVAPKQEYFEELFRVSRNQIIWGGNYFPLPPTRCFLIWRKLNIPLAGFSMAPIEYAWTSFNKNAAAFEAYSSANPKEPRFHPTQKPKALYDWIFRRYAEKGMKILDTHLGSGSSRLAAYDAGLDFVGCEIDKYYFDKQEERFAEYVAQSSLFVDESAQAEQIGLWSDET